MTLDSIVDKALSRRSFLTGAGAVAAASLVTGCNDPLPSYTAQDVLNFALNLEYLEAEFYLRAATGSGLQTSDTAAGTASPYQSAGSVTAGNAAQVPGLTVAQQNILNEIALEEQGHVRFLRQALGSAAVPRPAIDLSFFGPLASAAGISLPNNATFNPFTSFDTFLVGAFVFEDVGVTAYNGALNLLAQLHVVGGYIAQPNPDLTYSTAAAGIMAVEGYHAAYIRQTLTNNAAIAGSLAAYPYLGYANQVETLRQNLTVGTNTSVGTPVNPAVETALVLPAKIPSTGQVFYSASAVLAGDYQYSTAFTRTTNQVLHVVYGSPTVGVASGGFFPSGMNSIFAQATL